MRSRSAFTPLFLSYNVVSVYWTSSNSPLMLIEKARDDKDAISLVYIGIITLPGTSGESNGISAYR